MTSMLSSAPSTAGTGTAPARPSQRSPFASAANAPGAPAPTAALTKIRPAVGQRPRQVPEPVPGPDLADAGHRHADQGADARREVLGHGLILRQTGALGLRRRLQAVFSWWRAGVLRQRSRVPTSRPVREPRLCCVRGRLSRPRGSACGGGGNPRPESPTMTHMSVLLVERGDGEDGVPMPGRRAEGLANTRGSGQVPRVWPSAEGLAKCRGCRLHQRPQRNLSATPLTPVGECAIGAPAQDRRWHIHVGAPCPRYYYGARARMDLELCVLGFVGDQDAPLPRWAPADSSRRCDTGPRPRPPAWPAASCTSR